MRKFCTALLALIFVLALAACSDTPDVPVNESLSPTVTVTPEPSPSPEQTPSQSPAVSEPVESDPPAPFTAPEGTVVCGVDLSGMERGEALAALTDAPAGYVLTLDVSGKVVTVSSEDTAVTLDPALFDAYWQALEGGSELPDQLYSVNRAEVEQLLVNALEYSSKNPYVAYSKASGKFVVVPGSNGMDYNVAPIAEEAAAAMSRLLSECAVSATGYETAPAVSAGDPRLSAAAEAANQYLSVSLSYSFVNGLGGPIIESLDASTIASFVRISGSYAVTISQSAIETYVSTLAARYDADSYKGDFVTSNGVTVPYTVTYYGRQVDRAALTGDIYTCLTSGISGTHEAPFVSAEQAVMAYGGSYVEIDLTNQLLWVYKNGQRVVTTYIVSGCVADNNETPTGVFSIYNKASDCWLVGPTWRDHVDYWMPFYGAYGLHDASWRSEFGQDIYIHEGSHGCPNLPVEVAGQVYDNVSIGTPVIIYGGLTEPVDLVQELGVLNASGHSVSEGSFRLDISLRYEGAEVTYTSSNPEVLTVAEDGTVTIHGAGHANITVTAAPFTYHTGASLTVAVTISCSPDSHSYGEWNGSDPTCEDVGHRQRSCLVCSYLDVQEIPATGHSFGEDGLCVVCGAVETPAENETPTEEDPVDEENEVGEDVLPDGEDVPADEGSGSVE